ncbi:MAG: hypothetical protein IPM49_03445 [Flavobacteriales bacterium]|nr:hypothetical protein [Flavobacteriales bacterium]
MEQFLALALVPVWLGIPAKTGSGERAPTGSLPGIYGVRGCAEDATGAACVTLTISADGGYTFVDGSDPSNPIEQHGQWRVEGRTLRLRYADNEQVWTLDKDQPCLRARFGMRFERLCRLEECP